MNNAAAGALEWDKQTFDWVKRVNFDGTIKLTQALVPYLASGARIVHVSSVLG